MGNQTGESHRPAVVPYLLHGYSAGWILRLSLRRAPRTDANVILQDVTLHILTPYSQRISYNHMRGSIVHHNREPVPSRSRTPRHDGGSSHVARQIARHARLTFR